MKKTIGAVLALVAIGGAGYYYYSRRETTPAFTVSTAAVTRGDVVETVGATGTLQAVTTVQVGSQVSGTIQELRADFNSLVKKGQVLARLDPSLFQTQIEQAKANLIRAEADLDRLKVTLDDAQTKAARARELSGRGLIPKSELDTAEVNVRSAEAQIRSSQAQVTQAQASLNQNQVNLQHTIIQAPIDGLVISRSVDVGQTVQASMQAPTLFLLAADLTKMQVVANLDESDVGRIRPGQVVTFSVDAYPNDTFTGKVSQVRLAPTVQQNVVTYATVIDVPNQQLKLKPGMTANVNVEIARSSNVVRVPNAALRFRPTTEIYAALGLTPPDPAQMRAESGGRGGGRGTPPAAVPTTGADSAPTAPAASQPATSTTAPAAGGTAQGGGRGVAPTQPADRSNGEAGSEGGGTTRRRGANGGNGQASDGGEGSEAGAATGGGGRFAERMQNLSPEQRAQMLERMRARGADPTAAANTASRPAAGRGAAPAGATAPKTATGGATTIDALFGPLPREESVGRVWLYDNRQLDSVRLRLGITDGQNTELLQGELEPGTELVTNVSTATTATRPAATAFPGFGQQGRGGFGGNAGAGGNRGAGAGGR